MSNSGSTLVFEEPESNSFPYYTKYLGETIAGDSSNQYFIATHNPYLLTAIVEKTASSAINLFAVGYRDYQTTIRQLTTDEISELMDQDPFLALDQFLDD